MCTYIYIYIYINTYYSKSFMIYNGWMIGSSQIPPIKRNNAAKTYLLEPKTLHHFFSYRSCSQKLAYLYN